MFASNFQGVLQSKLFELSLSHLALMCMIQALSDTRFDKGPKDLRIVKCRRIWGQEQCPEVLVEVGNYLPAMMRCSIIQYQPGFN